MSRACCLFALAALGALGACGEPTYVLVSVSTGDLTVPNDVRSIRISATNPDEPTGAADAVFRTQDVVLCSPGSTVGCSVPPVTMSLSPGPGRPETRVRVQVDAFDASGALVSSDASLFSFTSSRHSELNFVLSRRCLMTRCAAEERACGPQGGCINLQPAGAEAQPDLASAPPPATPIARLALVSGEWQADATGVGTLIPPSFTQPGDRIMAIIEDAEPQSATWIRVGNFGGLRSARAFTRVAGADEASNLAAYRVVQRSRSAGTYRMLLYRNAGALRGTFESAAMQSTIVFPSVEVARAGSVLASVVDSQGCPGSTVALGNTMDLFERTVGAGPSGELVLSCSERAATVQYLVEPL